MATKNVFIHLHEGAVKSLLGDVSVYFGYHSSYDEFAVFMIVMRETVVPY